MLFVMNMEIGSSHIIRFLLKTQITITALLSAS